MRVSSRPATRTNGHSFARRCARPLLPLCGTTTGLEAVARRRRFAGLLAGSECPTTWRSTAKKSRDGIFSRYRTPTAALPARNTITADSPPKAGRRAQPPLDPRGRGGRPAPLRPQPAVLQKGAHLPRRDRGAGPVDFGPNENFLANWRRTRRPCARANAPAFVLHLQKCPSHPYPTYKQQQKKKQCHFRVQKEHLHGKMRLLHRRESNPWL